MKQAIRQLGYDTHGPGLTEITAELQLLLRELDFDSGLMTVHCQHTSASLLVTENASSAVHRDLVIWLESAAPEACAYEHDDEGPDDMPAHLKSVLTGVSLSLPFTDGKLMLGTWQGVFLAEHRHRPHRRLVAVHLLGT